MRILFGRRLKGFRRRARLCSVSALPRFHSFHGLSFMVTRAATRSLLLMPFGSLVVGPCSLSLMMAATSASSEGPGIVFTADVLFGDLDRSIASGLTKIGGHGVGNGDQRSPVVLGAIVERFRHRRVGVNQG